MHRLIFDLLSLARVEAGTDTLEPRRVPLGPFVGDCLARHRGRAEANGQVLEAIGPGGEGTEIAVWADEEALEQILGNLVDNALKYTPPATPQEATNAYGIARPGYPASDAGRLVGASLNWRANRS